MSRDARFWRNVTIIALVHVALLVALVRWSRETKRPTTKDVVWMNGGAGAESASAQPAANNSSAPTETPEEGAATTPAETPEPTQAAEADDERTVLTSAKSDIQLPTPSVTPRPTPKSTATPKPSVTPRAKPKPTPKETPKPKPKPKPSPKKKLVVKATPKPTATPKKKEKEEEEESAALKKKKEIARLALAREKQEADSDDNDAADKPAKKAASAHGGKSSGAGGNGGEGAGHGGASEFGWYGNMLHDRFYGEWIQPTTVVASAAKISALVKIRIEKDGTVSDFKIVKPSGNVVVDESIEAVAKRVTQVDPLPAGLGEGGHYDVNINFEFNPGE